MHRKSTYTNRGTVHRHNDSIVGLAAAESRCDHSFLLRIIDYGRSARKSLLVLALSKYCTLAFYQDQVVPGLDFATQYTHYLH
jgi:hypothetical protein